MDAYTCIKAYNSYGDNGILHYIVDPCGVKYHELKLTKNKDAKLLFGYTSKRNGFERDNFILDYLRSKCKYSNNKSINAVFGYTVSAPARKWLSDMRKDFEAAGVELYGRDKYNDIENRITHSEYLTKLSNSKFTVIVPAYKNDTFSVIRFYEAILSGCVPLILNTVAIDEALGTKCNHLIINSPNDIHTFIQEDKYQDLIKDLITKVDTIVN